MYWQTRVGDSDSVVHGSVTPEDSFFDVHRGPMEICLVWKVSGGAKKAEILALSLPSLAIFALRK